MKKELLVVLSFFIFCLYLLYLITVNKSEIASLRKDNTYLSVTNDNLRKLHNLDIMYITKTEELNNPKITLLDKLDIQSQMDGIREEKNRLDKLINQQK